MSELVHFLVNFSPKLKRDFLTILVRALSKEFSLPLKRKYWRTKEGAKSFLEFHSDKLFRLCSQDTFFSWFVTNYCKMEKIFSDFRFALFLLRFWNIFSDLLKRDDVMLQLRYYQNDILSGFSGQPVQNDNVKECVRFIIDSFVAYNREHISPKPFAEHDNVSHSIDNIISFEDDLDVLPKVCFDVFNQNYVGEQLFVHFE